MATKKIQKRSTTFNNLKTTVRTMAQSELPEVSILSEEERAVLLRPRAGYRKEAQHTAALARELDIRLPGRDLATLEADLERIEKLEALQQVLNDGVMPFLRAVDDTLLKERSRIWANFLAYYAVLSKIAESDPTLAERLKPVVDLMANPKRPKPANDDDEAVKPAKKVEDVA